MPNKLEAFRALLEADQRRGLLARGYNPDHLPHAARVKIGRKYANVDVARSGKYMVELSTGGIFGIKGYGVIHRGHQYGTLDTIGDWDWSGYTAVPKRRDDPTKTPAPRPAADWTPESARLRIGGTYGS